MNSMTHNNRVYQDFIDELMREGKVDNRQEGSFEAIVEIRPSGRYSPQVQYLLQIPLRFRQ